MYGLVVNGEAVCASGADTPLFQFDALSVSWITYLIAVEKLNGSPSSASLTPSFQGLMPSGQGNNEGVYTPTSNLPWFDINDTTCGDMRDLQPGGAWGTIASESFTNTNPVSPKVHLRRIRGGFPHRLMLRANFSGGSSPSWQVSVWANQDV
jgi:hypothetical protein